MRRIALSFVVCLSLFGALAQASGLHFGSLSRSFVHKKSTHHAAKARANNATKSSKKGSTKGSRKSSKASFVTAQAPVSPSETAAAASMVTTATAGSTTLFGDNTVESTLDQNSAGWAEAFPFSNQSSGTASAIVVYVAKQNQATKLIAGIYSDKNGNPGSLLTSGTLSAVKAGAWNTVSVTAATVQSGRTYWISLLGRGGTVYFNDRNGGSCASQNASQTSATSLASNWTTGPKWQSCPVSAYATGTLSTVGKTGSGSTGSGTTTTTATPDPPPVTVPTILPPVSLGGPTVSGNAVDGQTLTTSDGTWLDTPTSYSYQWQSCDNSGSACADIAGATGSSYTLTDSEIGKTVRSVVTAANSAGSAAANSAPTSAVAAPPAPVNTGAPAVTGSAVQGQTLSTTNGSWSGSPTMMAYQWQSCNSSGAGCSNIAGATGSSYTLGSGDVGHTVRSVVTASNTGGSNSASSSATAVVTAPAATAPSNTALPTVSGSTVQGQTLATTNGSWSGSPTMMAYQWQSCNSSGAGCSNIAGATGSSYTLGSGDVGHTVRSVVTASNTGGSNSAGSAATAAVTAPPAAPTNTALPTVSGTTTQGQSLSTSDGSWTGSPTSFSYKWQDCNSSGAGCSNIAGATGSSYTLGSSDAGHTVRSVVTAANSAGSQAATSAQTAAVSASVSPPSNTAAPTVSGTGTQGSTLSSSNGSWSGSPTSYAYQWQDCNTSGTGCANITGATSSSYTLQAGDVGDTVRSLVTAANSAGSASAPSTATATIIASGGGGGGGGGASSSYTCTQHVTTSTFSSAFSSAGSGAVLCLAPGSYGSFNGSSKSSMVVITPDISAGATSPTGNATGDANGNVTFSGADFSPASDITMDGITFTGDVSMAGNTHDITLHDSLFHQHLIIDDTSMNNANIDINYNMFPADKADCINGPEGRIWPHDTSHSSTPDGVVIENNNIGGATSQCDGMQVGGYGVQIIDNWIHDFHYQNSAHTDGIQDYGGRYEVVEGNFMYNVPDCYVSYDGTNHADVEDNICVNDGTQNNGASPNDLDILGDSGSIIKHNTIVAYKDSYNNAGGCITLGSKSGSSTGTTITDNIATCLVTDSGGHSASYTESHNMWVSSGPSGTGDVHGTPTYQGGSCASLSSSQSPFCSDGWSNYLLGSSSSGYTASDTGNAMGAYGPGPVAPGE